MENSDNLVQLTVDATSLKLLQSAALIALQNTGDEVYLGMYEEFTRIQSQFYSEVDEVDDTQL